MLGNMSIWHLLIFLAIVILVFGTGKLRNAGRDIGGFIKGFKDGMKSDEEKPQTPEQLTQQNNSTSANTVDKKDQV